MARTGQTAWLRGPHLRPHPASLSWLCCPFSAWPQKRSHLPGRKKPQNSPVETFRGRCCAWAEPQGSHWQPTPVPSPALRSGLPLAPGGTADTGSQRAQHTPAAPPIPRGERSQRGEPLAGAGREGVHGSSRSEGHALPRCGRDVCRAFLRGALSPKRPAGAACRPLFWDAVRHLPQGPAAPLGTPLTHRAGRSSSRWFVWEVIQ